MNVVSDRQACYRAMRANDRRFDGHFFVGVCSTGIFCRPVCPARLPKLENCTFYPSAAAAQQAGYRPCLRCRPELAPVVQVAGRSPAEAGAGVVAKALNLIEAGALDEQSVVELAGRLGVSDRTLRQQFARYVGTSPGQVAKTRRLLFAKRLIDETALSMTEIALSAGFKSIRSFNSTFQQTYGRAPSTLRPNVKKCDRNRQKANQQKGDRQKGDRPVTLKLPFSAPYNWAALMAFWQPRSVPGVEVAAPTRYCRSLVVGEHQGWATVTPAEGQPYLQVQIGFPQVSQLGKIMARLRQMFDVGVNVAAVEDCLRRSPLLQPLVSGQGLRIPGAWDAFELAVRAIVGQQVSVAAATTVFARIVETYGTPLAAPGKPPELFQVFPQPAVLARADLTALGLVSAKAKAIAHLAQIVSDHPHFFAEMTTLETSVNTLCTLPGIGPWTAHYIAMRALNEPDALPPGDLALLRATKHLGHEMTATQFAQLAEDWRPWRSYGAMHLWQFDAQLANRRQAS